MYCNKNIVDFFVIPKKYSFLFKNKHCVKSGRIRSYSGLHFTGFGYFLRRENFV